eukprot:3141303-Karenia_brevis.AAC.1
MFGKTESLCGRSGVRSKTITFRRASPCPFNRLKNIVGAPSHALGHGILCTSCVIMRALRLWDVSDTLPQLVMLITLLLPACRIGTPIIS